ncbi:uncharacterized protein LOC123307683 [Coccinella septempunctata]|uniref:uncharacterized protein LOC123307683 n=1 Tax=Coccinella septempunctata TaxID=41139 RepID=UPI001D09324D|nr:uncharacterized protein LOC123307683 [Coccinella septempunctata]
MQRILSLEASRGDFTVSESISKRLCCSFLILVAFFSLLGGYVLGNFISRRTQHIVKLELEDISGKVTALNDNLRSVFGNISANHNCNRTYVCYSYNMNNSYTSQQILDSLITCFSDI